MTDIKRSDFLDGAGNKIADCFTLSNGVSSVKITNYGGIIMDIIVPDRNGILADVNLGFDTLDGYKGCDGYLGAIIGRYANRIKGGAFCINDSGYTLYKNNGNNHLHGGKVGFDQKVWGYDIIEGDTGSELKLTLFSPDGQEGYPGNLVVTVIYSLSAQNGLGIEYKAVTDKDTIINLTNHAYFNLKGHDSGSIVDHEIMINSKLYTKPDSESIPTGEIVAVAGTPMDFTTYKPIGNCIDDFGYEDIKLAGGYDHNYIIDKKRYDKQLELAAVVKEASSGRVMKVLTNKPAVQLYTANMLANGVKGKGGCTYNRRGGLCLETQFYPDSPNKSHFTNCVLTAGEVYSYKTVYAFSAE